MRELATLKLDRGDELRVELDAADLQEDEIVVHRTVGLGDNGSAGLLSAIDEHLAHAERHPAGTTDRLLEADRRRPI
jgi:hypothetical protein